MPRTQLTGHLTDGDLVRLLDGEVTGNEQAETKAHLAGCESCHARFRRIEYRSARLGSLLDAQGVHTTVELRPATSPSHPVSALRLSTSQTTPVIAETPAPAWIWLRRAAIFVLLIGAGASATPAGATLARWISSQWTALVGARSAEPTPAATMPTGDPAVTRIRFTARPELLVEFAAHQAAGTIRVELGSGDDVVFEVMQEAGGPRNAVPPGVAPVELLVLPTGLRVQNLAGTTADYRVLVPPSSHLIRIRIGDSPPIELSAAELTPGGPGPIVQAWPR